MASATASQAWAILSRHARDEIAPLRLHELCSDSDRVSSLVAVHSKSESAASRLAGTSSPRHQQPQQQNGGRHLVGGFADPDPNRILLADLSRQRMTLDTVNHLLRLASARDVRGLARTLAWGQNDRHELVDAREGGTASEAWRAGGVSGGGGTFPGHHTPSSSSHHHRARFAEDAASSFSARSHGTGGSGRGGSGSYHGGGHAPLRTSPSMHIALRAPDGAGLEMLLSDGENALTGIHRDWKRIERLSESIRRAQLRGASGAAMRDVVVVGRGVAVAALKFMYDALCRDAEASGAASDGANSSEGTKASGRGDSHHKSAPPRRMRFVSSVDPVSAQSAVSDLQPASTIVVTINLRGDEETNLSMGILRNWLMRDLVSSRNRSEIVISKHMLLITADERHAQSVKPESLFLLPEHTRCEAFTTFTAAGLVPLSIVFGWGVVRQVIAGAHDLDSHFADTCPRHNLPILLALADVWNDAFLGSSGRVVSPFAQGAASYPAFVAAIEAQTCGRSGGGGSSSSALGGGRRKNSDAPSALVIDGGTAGAYDRALFRGGRTLPCELIVPMDAPRVGVGSPDDDAETRLAAHDALVCSAFAHADAMAFGSAGWRDDCGSGSGGNVGRSRSFGLSPTRDDYDFDEDEHDHEDGDGSVGSPEGGGEGNRPSTVLMVGRLDAFACGQLVALAEHRAAVAARLWDVDPFACFSRAGGTSFRSKQTERLKERLQSMHDHLDMGESLEEDGADEGGGPDQRSGPKLNLATSTILSHYANRMRDQRMYVVNSA